jgi:predicted metal-dependent phosphotriesterase family hydrolase
VFNDTTQVVEHPVPPCALADAIRTVGAQHCIMATDSGQWRNPMPVQQMGIFIQEMMNQGFTKQELRLMLTDNPAHLLGI